MSEPYIGQIYLVGYNFAQRAFALCQGQLLPISSNTALFSLLGTIYGGDGRTTFALPDLRGRSAIGMGNGPGLTGRSIGQRGGQERHTLTQSEMPQHNHTTTLRGSEEDAISTDPATGVLAAGALYHAGAPDVSFPSSAITAGNAGGSQPHNNMQPYLVLNYEIALQGVFPSRN
jgi:microcystin-dependent protein